MMRLVIFIIAAIVCMNVDMGEGCSCAGVTYCNAKWLLHIDITSTTVILPGVSWQDFINNGPDTYFQFSYHQHDIKIIGVIKKPKKVKCRKLPEILQTGIAGNLCGVQLAEGQYIMDVSLGTSVLNPNDQVFTHGLCDFIGPIDLLTNPPDCGPSSITDVLIPGR